MIIKRHPYSETFKNMNVGDTYIFDKDLMSGVLYEVDDSKCPICLGFGYYTIGGSFGSETIKQICNCGGNIGKI